MYKVLFIVFVFSLTIGCNSSTDKVKVIPDEDVIQILKDIHIADATYQTTDKRRSLNRYDSIQYYDTIFKKYGYTRIQFDSTINRLSGDPERYIEIYEKVMADLSKYESELDKESKEIKELYFKSNIWNKKENWNLPNDGEREKIEFDIPIKGPGKYTITTRIKMYNDDKSMNPKITAYFFKEDSTELGVRQNFPSKSIDKNNVLREYKISADLSDTTFTSLRGAILDHSNPNEDWEKHVLVNQIKVIYIPKKDKVALPR